MDEFICILLFNIQNCLGATMKVHCSDRLFSVFDALTQGFKTGAISIHFYRPQYRFLTVQNTTCKYKIIFTQQY